MLKRLEHWNTIYSIFTIGSSLFIDKGTLLQSKNGSLHLEEPNSYRPGNGYISTLSKGKINIYNEQLKLVSSILDKDIDLESSGIEVLNDGSYVAFKTTDTTTASFYINHTKAKEAKNFWGKILSASYRLNFKENTFDNPTYFRCSDLLDTVTYFEYQCDANETVIDNFVLWKESLVFPLIRSNQLYIRMINLPNGELLWEEKISYSYFKIDERGLLVSVWGNDGLFPGKLRQYQVIDLEKRSIEIGLPKGAGPFYNVNTPMHLQRLYGDRFYFSDNRHSYAGEEPNPVRVGCFNIATRTVDLLVEMNESPKSPISHIVEHEGKLYVHNANYELFVFELPE